MPKYFVDASDIDNGRVIMRGENADHLITVVRARPGDSVIVCDGWRMDYICEIADISSGKDRYLTLRIQSKREAPEPLLKTTIYQALPKADKMEYIIQKCVEMGVTDIIPVYTDNSEIKILSEAKLSRYRKISEASAKQCMRGIIPRIGAPIALEQAVADSRGCDLVFAPYENERQTGLKDFLRGRNMGEIRSCAYFIGSEGGFSDREADMFTEAAIPLVSLGNRILRTETAGFAVLTVLMYMCGELGASKGEWDGKN